MIIKVEAGNRYYQYGYYSIEGIERTLIFSQGKNNQFLHAKFKLINPIKLPIKPEKEDNYLKEKIDAYLVDVEVSPRRSFDIRLGNSLYVISNSVLSGNFVIYNDEKIVTFCDENYTFLVKNREYARRYTPDDQLKELHEFYDICWEMDRLVLMEILNHAEFEAIVKTEKIRIGNEKKEGQLQRIENEKVKLYVNNKNEIKGVKFLKSKRVKIACSQLNVIRIDAEFAKQIIPQSYLIQDYKRIAYIILDHKLGLYLAWPKRLGEDNFEQVKNFWLAKH